MERKPRKMGITDRAIADAKRAAIEATNDNVIGMPLMSRQACLIVTYHVRQRLLHLHNQPSNFRGAQYFTAKGDFTGIAAVGFL